jgi:hypothetical protein
MPDTAYNEDEIVKAHLSQWLYTHYMSDFERRCYYLGVQLANANPGPDLPQAAVIRGKFTIIPEQVRRALAHGVDAFVQNVRGRLWRKYQQGTLCVNRCRMCQRVVRTPLAKQCFWCGNDWHEK